MSKGGQNWRGRRGWDGDRARGPVLGQPETAPSPVALPHLAAASSLREFLKELSNPPGRSLCPPMRAGTPELTLVIWV